MLSELFLDFFFFLEDFLFFLFDDLDELDWELELELEEEDLCEDAMVEFSNNSERS